MRDAHLSCGITCFELYQFDTDRNEVVALFRDEVSSMTWRHCITAVRAGVFRSDGHGNLSEQVHLRKRAPAGVLSMVDTSSLRAAVELPISSAIKIALLFKRASY